MKCMCTGFEPLSARFTATFRSAEKCNLTEIALISAWSQVGFFQVLDLSGGKRETTEKKLTPSHSPPMERGG
jgi:hypothetical protein